MVCPPGFLCSRGLARDPRRSATLCPRGFYCPGGGIVSWISGHSVLLLLLETSWHIFLQDPNPIPCPNGTYSEHPGLSEVSECVPCPGGKYCYSQHPEEHPITAPVRLQRSCVFNYNLICTLWSGPLIHFWRREKKSTGTCDLVLVCYLAVLCCTWMVISVKNNKSVFILLFASNTFVFGLRLVDLLHFFIHTCTYFVHIWHFWHVSCSEVRGSLLALIKKNWGPLDCCCPSLTYTQYEQKYWDTLPSLQPVISS